MILGEVQKCLKLSFKAKKKKETKMSKNNYQNTQQNE